MKHWATFNEPDNFCYRAYSIGEHAPGRCSPWEVGKCNVGDSATEPYIVGHHILLAHAATVKLYRERYQVGCFPNVANTFEARAECRMVSRG